MRILIAVPTFETIAPETFGSIYDLETGSNEVSFDFVKGYDCARARNKIAEKALGGVFNYVLMIDSDMIVPKNALIHMLEDPADIVFGCYPRKNTKEGVSELFKPGQTDFRERFSFSELEDKKRIEVKGGGMGCCLIDTRLFVQLPYPWFMYECFETGEHLSEDLYFCDTAAKAGMRIVADTRVRCGHLMRTVQYE